MKKLLLLTIMLIVFIIVHTCVYSQDTLTSKSNNAYNFTRFILTSCKASVKHIISNTKSFDIYPSNTPNSPVIIFYYGGKYHIGNKSQYKYIGKRLSKLGYTVVITQQLKYPKYQFKDIIDNQLVLLKEIKVSLLDFNSDTNNISVMGHSSGGHLASYIYNLDTTIKNCILIDPYGLALTEYYTSHILDNTDKQLINVFNDNIYSFSNYDLSIINTRTNYTIFVGENTLYRVKYHSIRFIELNPNKLYIMPNKTHLSMITGLFNNNSIIYSKIKQMIK
jgi:hypothetical protein